MTALRKWLWRGTASLLLVVAVACAGIAWLAFTASGAQTLLSAAASLSGGLFTYGGASGTLARTLRLDDVVVTLEGLDVAIDRLTLSWRPGSLAAATAHIERLEFDGVRVDYVSGPAVERVPGKLELAYIAPPLPVRIGRLAVTGADVRIDETPLRIDSVAGGVRWGPRRLLLERLAIALPDHEIAGSVRVDRGEPLVADVALDWAGRVGEYQAALALSARGPLDALAIDAALESLARARLSGSVDVVAASPAFDLVLDVDELTVPPGPEPAATLSATRLSVDGNVDAIDAEVEARLAPTGGSPRTVALAASLRRDSGPAAGTVEFSWTATGDEAEPWPRLAGRGRLRLADAQIDFEHASDAPVGSRLSGSIPVPPDSGALDARLELERIEVPMAAVVVERGEVTAAGPIAGFDVGGTIGLTVPTAGLVDARFDLGVVPGSSVDLRTVEAELLDGSAAVSGSITLGDPVRADLSFKLSRLDAGLIDAALASRIDADGRIALAQDAAGLRAALEVGRVAGQWRGQPLSGHVRATVEPDAIEVDSARLAAGPNTVSLSGTLREQLQGEFALELVDLAALLPGAGGRATATGSVGGTLARPVVAASADAREFRYQGVRVDDLDLAVDLDLASARPSEVTLRAAAIERDGVRINRIDVLASGTEAAHLLEIAVVAPAATIDTRLRGGAAPERDAWTGTLEALQIASADYGEWAALTAPVIGIAGGAVNLERVCLARNAGRACASIDGWAGAKGQAVIELAALPLELLEPLLPAGAGLEGTVEGRFEARQSAAGPTAVGALEGRATRLTLSLGASTEVVPIDPLRIELDLAPEALTATVRFQLADWLIADAAYRGGLGADAALDGRLDVTSEDLAWVSEFVPEIGAGGGFELHASASGKVTAPDAKLSASLVDGFIQLRDTGLRLDRVELALEAAGTQQADIRARFGAGAGALAIDGDVTLDPAAGWPARMKVVGSDLPIVRLPDVEADVSPDLAIDASLKHVDVRGRVVVPRVDLSLSTAPATAVNVSSDEVLVGSTGAPREQPEEPEFVATKVSGDVNVVLGDSVTIGGAGLAAKLSGGLRWTKREGELSGRGEGTIAIDEGSYTAYGQNLEVERGALIFAGPIDNPQIDLRAVRPDLDVTAGVRASGSLRSPQLRLFSSPTMSDGEILSYIITGKALNNASSSDANLITKAALSLGREQSSVVTNQIRDTFGLDELSVNTGDTATDTSFVAGKRLTPKLSVRSDFNPFDQLWSFFLNYKLSRAISVEAESGVRQGADIIYSIERDTVLPQSWPDWNALNPLEWFD